MVAPAGERIGNIAEGGLDGFLIFGEARHFAGLP